MCGIAGIHRRGDTKIAKVNRLADCLLLGIEHRGYDSTGVLAMMDSGRVQVEKVTEKASKFIKRRKTIRASARSVLLHTRFATKGAIIPRNAHPVIAGRMAATHNGTIYNDDELFAEHGMKRTAEVDSVVIPALLSHLGWDKAAKALSKLRGGAAIAAVNADAPDELLLARTQGYPLHVLVTDDVVVWASERRIIEQAWLYTYGEITPAGASWIEVAEWTMLRVNGTVEVSKLQRPPKPKPLKPLKSKRSKWPAARPVSTWKRPTVVKETRQLELPTEHEPYMDDAVRDLMAWADCDYEDAYEQVFGVMPPDVDDSLVWVDDILMTRAAKAARRRADGWEVGL